MSYGFPFNFKFILTVLFKIKAIQINKIGTTILNMRGYADDNMLPPKYINVINNKNLIGYGILLQFRNVGIRVYKRKTHKIAFCGILNSVLGVCFA